VAIISLYNPMGGIYEPFLDQYVWTDAYGTDWVLTYTPYMAGGSGPGAFYEGWTVGGDAWVPGEPEIFCYPPDWWSHEPDESDWPMFDSFLNGTDGTGGLRYVGAITQDFLPANMPEHLGQTLILTVAGSDVGLYRGVTIHADVASDDTQYHNLQAAGQSLALTAGGSDAVLVVLDDFNDGDISDYDWDVDYYFASASAAHEGDYGLENYMMDGVPYRIRRSDIITEQGKRYEWWGRISDHWGPDQCQFLYGIEYQETPTIIDRAYRAGLSFDNYDLAIELRDWYGGATTLIASAGLSSDDWSSGVWYQFVLEWDTEGTHTLSMYDEQGNLIATCTGTDTTMTSGPAGWETQHWG